MYRVEILCYECEYSNLLQFLVKYLMRIYLDSLMLKVVNIAC